LKFKLQAKQQQQQGNATQHNHSSRN